MKNGVLSNFTRSHISSDRVRSGYEISVDKEKATGKILKKSLDRIYSHSKITVFSNYIKSAPENFFKLSIIAPISCKIG